MYIPRIDPSVQTVIFVALAMLAISTLYPPADAQFGYFVAGAFVGYVFLVVRDLRHVRSVTPNRFQTARSGIN